MIAVDILCVYVNGKEHGSHPALPQPGNISVILGRVTNVRAIDRKARNIVVSVDQNARFRDSFHPGVDFVLVNGVSREGVRHEQEK
jgi:hypothetical protein